MDPEALSAALLAVIAPIAEARREGSADGSHASRICRSSAPRTATTGTGRPTPRSSSRRPSARTRASSRPRSPRASRRVPGIASVEVAGPGFINIRLDAAAAGALAKTIVDAGAAFGTNESQRGQVDQRRVRQREPDRSAAHRPHPVGRPRRLDRAAAARQRRDRRARVLHQRRRRADGAVRPLGARRGEGGADARGRLRRQLHRRARASRALRAPRPARARRRGAARRRSRDLALRPAARASSSPRSRSSTSTSTCGSRSGCCTRRRLTAARAWSTRRSTACARRGTSSTRTAPSGCARPTSATTATASSAARTACYTYFAADAAYYLNKSDRGFHHKIYLLGADHHGYVHRLKALRRRRRRRPRQGHRGADRPARLDQRGAAVQARGQHHRDGRPPRVARHGRAALLAGALPRRLAADARSRAAAQAHQRQPGVLRAVRARPHAQRRTQCRGIRCPPHGVRTRAAHPRDRVGAARRAPGVPADRRASPPSCASRTASRATSRSSPGSTTAGTTTAGSSRSGEEPVEAVHRTRRWLNDATGQVLRNGLDLLGVDAPGADVAADERRRHAADPADPEGMGATPEPARRRRRAWPWIVAFAIVVGLAVVAWFAGEAIARDVVTEDDPRPGRHPARAARRPGGAGRRAGAR